MTRILAVHAHPDDIETLAAGALTLLSRSGCEISIVTATAGEGGASEQDPQETGRVRLGEAAAAAAMIGARYACVGLPDLGVFNDDATRRKIVELLRRERPNLVLAPSPADYHPDHEAVSLLVRDACFASSVPNYRAGDASALPAIPHLYWMDPIEGSDRESRPSAPEFGADIASVFEDKKRMLQAHVSQVAWVARQHGVADPAAAMERWSRRRGRLFGVPFAEGFRHYRHHPYPQSPLLQTLLAEALVFPAPGPG